MRRRRGLGNLLVRRRWCRCGIRGGNRRRGRSRNVLSSRRYSHRSRDRDNVAASGPSSRSVRICRYSTFDAVSRREESVETLNERRMTSEQRRNSINHSGSVDAESPSLLISYPVSPNLFTERERDSLLCFEILHDAVHGKEV